MDEVMPVPLHSHSHYSLLRGVGSPDQLVERAAELGYTQLALTDRDALYGAVRFRNACRERGVRPIYGVELTLDTEPVASHVTLLAMNRTGYGNLARLVSRARLGRDKGEALLPFAELADHNAGLFCLSGPSISGEVARWLRVGRFEEAERAASRYREAFGDRYFLELQHHALPRDDWLLAELSALGKRLGISTVATHDVHYPSPEDRALQDVVTCIRTRTALSGPSSERLPNGQFYLRAPDEFARPFHRRYPEALENTRSIADLCDVDLDFRDARFPHLELPRGRTPDEELRRLCYEGARRRYGEISERVRRQLEHELGIVATRGMAPFFLIAADIACGFKGRCRGSAAGSLVAFTLGMAAVDPLEHGMLFERFVNSERESPPDIDLDFSEPGREQAIRYCYETYGAERAAMVCNYVRFRARSAVRDVGKVLGMPPPMLDKLAKSLDHHVDAGEIAQRIAAFARRSPDAQQPWPLLARLCAQLDDVPRHLSIHVGGMLLTGRPLIEMLGLEPARKAGIVVVGADKEDVEDLGLAKLDLLCLRAMSVVQECEAMERARGVSLDLDQVPLDDPCVYEALGRADTIGASQVESRAQQQSLARTRPRNFRDLMGQVAIIRPGPIVGGMIHPYYRRRAGVEPVRYLHPSLEPVLRDTLGIFLYQEQILLGVSALTGCSAGEADQFRRAMGSHRSQEAMERLRPWFMERAVVHGIPASIARAAFQQISGFASFGFCRSHAGALARLAYETMWLRLYHPAAFYASLLNNQPMGFYPPAVLFWDARRRGVSFRQVDINLSETRCTLEGDEPAVRLGFSRVKGLGEAAAELIVTERERGGPYASLADFAWRTGIVGKPLEYLVLAGAFDRWDVSREQLLWDTFALTGQGGRPGLDLSEERPELPERSAHERTLLDYAVLGFSLDHHLVGHYRRRLKALKVTSSHELAGRPEGAMVAVGGVVVCRQRPGTAKGFVFITLEDEGGLVNVIISPDVYKRYRHVLRNEPLVAIAGRVQHNRGTVNVLAERAVSLDLSVPDAELVEEHVHFALGSPVRSHDFR